MWHTVQMVRQVPSVWQYTQAVHGRGLTYQQRQYQQVSKHMKQSDRITKIETDVKLIQKDITVIKNNHLKHIEDDVKKIDMRFWAVLIILVASVFIPFVKNLW